MPNILADALNSIQGLIKNQSIEIFTYEIKNVSGLPKETITKTLETFAHIQPITPNELKKFTDSTIDSAECYKFFIMGDNAELINSLNLPLKKSYFKWNDRAYKIYAKKDWSLNGWVCLYATLSNIDLNVL